LRVRELLGTDDVDVDEMAKELDYPLRRTHLALILGYSEPTTGDELVAMERFVTELGNRPIGAEYSPAS
jgi:hypothetical protein